MYIRTRNALYAIGSLN